MTIQEIALIPKIIVTLNAAVNNAQLYALSHPQVRLLVEKARDALELLLRNRSEITFLRIDDELIVDGRSLPGEKTAKARFIQILTLHAIGHLTILRGFSEKELIHLIKGLSSSGGQVIKSGSYIKLGQVELLLDKKNDEDEDAIVDQDSHLKDQIGELIELRDEKLDNIRTLYQAIKVHKKFKIRELEQMVMVFIKGFRNGINPLYLLSRLKTFDDYTVTHVINVCILTMAQATALGFGDSQLHQIGTASVLHDIGKLFIPDEIIKKPGKLTPKERAIIETHTVKGACNLLSLGTLPKLASLGALEHHIRFDGVGYPRLGSRWRSNIVSQMIAISDVYDAMRSRRPYKEPQPRDEILKVLQKEKRSVFNPLLVENFIRLLKP